MHRTSNRRGFTLVELLVVIAIIGILIGMLLPAVQSVRAAARRSLCMNNTRQLVLAMHNYESAHMEFPNGHRLTPGQHTTWIVKTLPFLEQGNFTNLLPNNIFTGAQVPAAQIGIPFLTCPSEDIVPDGQLIPGGNINRSTWWWNNRLGSTNYKACLGSNWHPLGTPYNRDGVGRHSGTMFDLELGDGMFPRNFEERGVNLRGNGYVSTTFGNLTDGSSNTVAIGEALPNWCDDSCFVDVNGTLATLAIPVNLYKTQVSREPFAGDWRTSYGFASNHPGGAVFGRADGSAEFVSESVNSDVYWAMGTIAGGEVATFE